MIKSEYQSILNKLSKKAPRRKTDDILIIDSLNTFLRSFVTVKSINPKGSHVGGLVGFLRSLGFLVRTFNPTWVICVFDGKGSTINRKNIDSNYKANRDTARITHWGMYDSREEERKSIADQIGRLYDYLEVLPVSRLTIDKVEADDVISFVAQEFSSRGKKATIVSSDKDFLQLVREGIEVYAPIKKKLYTKDNINETLGVLAENYLLIKALTGDLTDNLRGIKGAGLKTLVNFYPDLNKVKVELDQIYQQAEQNINKRKLYAQIVHEWDVVERNYKLMDLMIPNLGIEEKEFILEELVKDVPKLQPGAFLHFLDKDGIEGITKNTDSWLETFRSLTLYK